MPQHQLIISVMGGLVESVFTDATDLEVVICDFDVTADEQPHPNYVEFESGGMLQRAVVFPVTTEAMSQISKSPVGLALCEAELACEPP